MTVRVVDTGTEFVRVEAVDRVGIITLNRPDRRNALHEDMYEPMIAAVEGFAEADDVGCIVLTGQGKGFCAGGDVRDGSRRRPDGTKPTRDESIGRLTDRSRISVVLREAPIVTIAAVNGAAVGAGLSLALACDLRIAASSARLITGWARLGFSGDLGGPWLLAERLGHGRALQMLATNEAVDADEALALGLVDRVVPDRDFARRWHDWAGEFAKGPRAAIGLMKENVRNHRRLTLAEAVAAEAANQFTAAQSDDHREGVRAWLEKREPNFGPRERETRDE